MGQRHVIGRQKIELRVAQERNVYELQQKMSRYFWDKLFPELEALFDQLAPGDEIVRIGRLEIDLGHFTVDEVTKESFRVELVNHLKEELSVLAKPDAGGLTKLSIPQNSFDQWIYFMEKGCLPWQNTNPEDSWLKEVLDTLGLESSAIAKLQDSVKGEKKILNRLVFQHDDTFLCSVTELYSGHTQKPLISLQSELNTMKTMFRDLTAIVYKNLGIRSRDFWTNTINYKDLRTLFWNSILTRTIIHGDRLTWKLLAIDAILQLFPKDVIKDLKKLTKRKVFSGLKHIIQVLKEISLMEDPAILPEPSNTTKYAELPETNLKDHIKKKAFRAAEDLANDNEESKIITEGSDEANVGNEWYIRNAGLILIHPFISHLFKNLDLLQDNAFKNREDQQKAVQLLYFLHSGNVEIPEYELVLPKVLCHYPLGFPVDKRSLLSTEEMSEGDKMLQVLIEQWGVLGSTTPDGLREGFLNRGGKLSRKANGWHLQVEEKTLDVLLDKLPWSISMVKLPWMKELMQVDWR